MVQAASGVFTARAVSALSTSGNRPHSPIAWAQAVANGMISIDPTMPPERRAVAFNVVQQVIRVLLQAFSSLKPSTAHDDIVLMAEASVDEIRHIFEKTMWSFEADAPQVRNEFQRYIQLNLTDAAHLIKRMEF